MMTRDLIAFSSLVLLLAGAAGCDKASGSERDPIEISERYSNRVKGPCATWLRSHKSGYLYCANPPFTVDADMPVEAAPAPAAAAAGGSDAGKDIYNRVCVACHQADGKGLPGTFPPLAGSGDYYGDAQNMARIIVHGLQGEIVVQGQTYSGVMPPQGGLSDEDIAAVATYVRTSFGNDDGPVTAADVAAVR